MKRQGHWNSSCDIARCIIYQDRYSYKIEIQSKLLKNTTQLPTPLYSLVFPGLEANFLPHYSSVAGNRTGLTLLQTSHNFPHQGQYTCLQVELREREARSSELERELNLFPLLEIESSDIILARTFQGAKLSNCQLNVFLSFQCIFGNVNNCIGKLSQCVSKRWECFRTKPKYVENHLKIGPTHLQNIFKPWQRIWRVKRQVICFISPMKRLYRTDRTTHCACEDFVYILMTAEIMSIRFAKIFKMLYFECTSNNNINTGYC